MPRIETLEIPKPKVCMYCGKDNIKFSRHTRFKENMQNWFCLEPDPTAPVWYEIISYSVECLDCLKRYKIEAV
jgi:hypothetical protein